MDCIEGYIKATTAHGGDEEDSYSTYLTEQDRELFEQWLERQPKVFGKTMYRGYCFDNGYWDDCMVKVGSEIGVDQLTQSTELPAFTSDNLRAATYMNQFGEGTILGDGISVFFEVHTCGNGFVDISALSCYPEEKEVRCKRGTRLVVKSIVRRGGYFHVACDEK